MAQQQGVNLPGRFGGLMRFNEEYSSLINLKPVHVMMFVILIVLFRISLPFFFG
jgi:preprotein translocase subunit Sec61beta